MNDPYDLRRFESAQNPVLSRCAQNCEKARNEVTGCGSFFLSLRGLGHSQMAV